MVVERKVHELVIYMDNMIELGSIKTYEDFRKTLKEYYKSEKFLDTSSRMGEQASIYIGNMVSSYIICKCDELFGAKLCQESLNAIKKLVESTTVSFINILSPLSISMVKSIPEAMLEYAWISKITAMACEEKSVQTRVDLITQIHSQIESGQIDVLVMDHNRVFVKGVENQQLVDTCSNYNHYIDEIVKRLNEKGVYTNINTMHDFSEFLNEDIEYNYIRVTISGKGNLDFIAKDFNK